MLRSLDQPAPQPLPPDILSRVRCLAIMPEMFVHMMAGSYRETDCGSHLVLVQQGLPPDAFFVRADVRFETKAILVVVAHPSFEPVPAGCPIPHFHPMFCFVSVDHVPAWLREQAEKRGGDTPVILGAK